MNNENERVTYEEFMTMFKFAPRMCYTLYDKAEDEITQLTNNWNELEEWLKQMSMGTLEYNAYDDVLDKMKEINGGNK